MVPFLTFDVVCGFTIIIIIFKLTISNPKQPNHKKCVASQEGHYEKRCEIQGGGQEMA